MNRMDTSPIRTGGLLLVDKPAGMSSAAVVAVVRRLARGAKTGHGGTLDPFATGLLPVLIGREWTRRAEELLGGDKEYRLVVRFGSETDSGDLTGRVTSVSVLRPAEAEVREAVRAFLGVSRQEAPAFSALKIGGKPMYWYARRGLETAKADREVVVHRIAVVEMLGPDATLDVACGKGTYMRVLARDLGRALGCFGHLSALRRTAVGEWRVEDAVPLWRLVEEYGT